MTESKKKSFRTLPADLKKIRQQRPSDIEIERLNRILEERPKEQGPTTRKIAHSPDLEH